jgi:hypothetical protein
MNPGLIFPRPSHVPGSAVKMKMARALTTLIPKNTVRPDPTLNVLPPISMAPLGKRYNEDYHSTRESYNRQNVGGLL